MKYEYERERQHPAEEPSLAEMTSTAIRMLSKNKEKGFFLMVEGAKIDMGHHDGKVRQLPLWKFLHQSPEHKINCMLLSLGSFGCSFYNKAVAYLI